MVYCLGVENEQKTQRIGRFEVPVAVTRTGRPALPQREDESDAAYAKRLKNREKMRRYREAHPTYFRDWHREAVAKGTVKRQRENPETRRAKGARRYARARTWLDEQKQGPCLDCGDAFPPAVMDLDHRDAGEKCFTVGPRIMAVSRERLVAEIAKCDLVCANCHRIRSWRIRKHTTKAECDLVQTPHAVKQRRLNSEAKARLDAIQDVPCADCAKRFDPVCMDFDHRDPSQKSFNIGQSRRLRWPLVLAEIAKCDIVCANCHRIRTHVVA